MNNASELNEDERKRIAKLRVDVHELVPGAIPLLRELLQAGLIEGWRNVLYVGPPRLVAGVPADVYLHNSAADKEVRERNGTLANADH